MFKLLFEIEAWQLTRRPRSHTKEHMLVALKSNVDDEGNLKWPSWLNRGLDVDVIVSEVRETSRKPDEVYGMIERMCPGGRKLGQYYCSFSFRLSSFSHSHFNSRDLR